MLGERKKILQNLRKTLAQTFGTAIVGGTFVAAPLAWPVPPGRQRELGRRCPVRVRRQLVDRDR